MHSTYHRTILSTTALAATLILAAAVANASANRLSTSSQSIRAVWSNLNFEGAFEQTLSCPITLEGTLHSRTITKVAEALIGFITRATANPGACTGGGMTILQARLPWHLRYAGFEGILPDISAINTRVIGFSFQFSEGLFTCLFTSSASQPVTTKFHFRPETHVLQSATLGGSITSNEGCVFGARATGTLSGTSSSISALTVTLI